MKTIEIAAARKRELDLLRPISAEQEARIWQKFRFDWNYHSNNIEGNSLTFGETKSLLLHNITAQGKPLKDHIEITGHNEAINSLTAITSGNEPLTESFIRNLHLLILREPYLSKAKTEEGVATTKMIEVGKYKATANHVVTSTGETFRFAEPLDVPEKMHALVQFINNAADKSAAKSILEAAKVHYDFVMIHPFDDGNGRLARILMNLVFIKNGFPPAIIKTEDKANYYAALRQADGGQFEPFAEYIAGCVVASLNIILAGARGESIEEPDEQDKQIKMLQRLLENKSGKIEVVRSIESILEVFLEIFRPLSLKLDLASRKFSTLYVESSNFIGFNGGGRKMLNGPEVELDYIQSNISLSTTSFIFQNHFQHLKFEGLDHFSHIDSLEIKVSPASYEITTFCTSPFQKSYGTVLTNSEMETIVKTMSKNHITAIEQVSGIKLTDL
jgi:Fic family protein